MPFKNIYNNIADFIVGLGALSLMLIGLLFAAVLLLVIIVMLPLAIPFLFLALHIILIFLLFFAVILSLKFIGKKTREHFSRSKSRRKSS